MHRARISLIHAAITAMLTLGVTAILTSIAYTSSVLAFIGLGLAFWGAILLYIRPEEYTKKVLLEAVLSPSLTTLNEMIQEFAYKGDATYLPPKYFTHPGTTKIYVSKRKDASLPTPEEIQKYENQPVARTTQGLLLTPPGTQMSRLLEKSLGTSFIVMNLENLQRKLPKHFIENLEIAENLEIQAENNKTGKKTDGTKSPLPMKNTTIHAKITKPIYEIIFKQTEDSQQSNALIGCPISSAIAIAIAKAAGKPVRITDLKNSEDGNILEASYEIIEG
jgi:hypothetical protein